MNNISTQNLQALDNPVIVQAIADKISSNGSVIHMKDNQVIVAPIETLDKLEKIIDKISISKNNNHTKYTDMVKNAMNAATFETSEPSPVAVATYPQDANPEKIKQQLAGIADLNNLRFGVENKAELNQAVDSQGLTGEKALSQAVGNHSQRILEQKAGQAIEQDAAMQR